MRPTAITLNGTGLGNLPSSAEVRAELEALFGRALSFVVPGDTYAALELMRATEQEFRVCAQKLEAMHAMGAATRKDYESYEALRQNVFALEKRLTMSVRSTLGRIVGPDAAARVPTPVIAPAITASSPRTTSGWSGRRGLGAALETALVIGAVLLLIVALAVTAYFVTEALTEANQRDVALVAEQARLVKEMYASRAGYVADCTAAGSDPSTCAAEAERLYPTPEEAGLRVPQSGEGWGWVPWAVGALGVTVIAVLGYRVYSRERGRAGTAGLRGTSLPVRAAQVRGRPKRRALTASARSRYGMEVR